MVNSSLLIRFKRGGIEAGRQETKTGVFGWHLADHARAVDAIANDAALR
jgi:hypothetical protein